MWPHLRDNGGMLDIQTRQKVGRNDRCPCGSGKKYKHCCLHESQTRAIAEANSPWRLQHEASDRLTGEMMRFAASRYGEELLLAWQDFNQEPLPEMMDKFPNEEQIFMPYFLFDWDPNRPAKTRRKRRYVGVVAQEFLERRSKGLGELEARIFLLSIETPLSFYEIVSCEPGFGVRVRDVLIGGEADVEEHSASRTVQVGDILYGQICHLPGVNAFSRLSPTALRPSRKAELVKLRAWLRQKAAKQGREPGAEELIRYEERIRTEYLNARDAAHMPLTLANTDGELLLLHTIRYRVGSAQVAFDALASLAYGETKRDLLEAADFGPDGEMRGAKFEWRKPGNKMHKDWDNTILGHIKIDGRTLTVDVNSAKRAEKLRAEIEKRLGFMAVLESTSTLSQEEMRKSAQQKRYAKGAEDDELPASDPEAIEIARTMLLNHAEAWVDTEIPALGGRTPRQAVANPDGREAVEGLLLEWERRNSESGDPLMQSFDVGIVRRKLGL